jgi:hypothetical protein
VLAYNYPLLDIFWSMLWVFLFFLWIYLIVIVLMDVFRSRDLGGLAKALWTIFVIVIPWLGVLIYVIARGKGMQERSGREAAAQKADFDAYVRQTAGSASTADQLEKLVGLRDAGALTEAEFQAQKAKLLA